jgi:saccharopine dehydrogenase-like NADP-dependent oxidoreductase
MLVTVVGLGAVGARAARQLATCSGVDGVLVTDVQPGRAEQVAASLGPHARAVQWGDADARQASVVLLAGAEEHPRHAEEALEQGAHVVSVADDIEDVRHLLSLDADARAHDRHVVAGAGFAPGLSCVLARHAAAELEGVDEIHVAKVGTGGPECARQHHRALGDEAVDWRDGAWARRRGGSGRELCWFPDPLGAVDCYRAARPDTLLLVPAFPGVQRVTARVGANRRNRLTARLPMLRRPHPEGGPGAIRVEVRGWRGRARDVKVLGAMEFPSVAAAATAAVAVGFIAEGRMARPGAGGLAELVEPLPFLAELARLGIRAATFVGAATPTR